MKKAHLRLLPDKNQCELVFHLQLTDKDSTTVVDKEIHSVRANTDNIQSLLDHTKRKILKLIESTILLHHDVNISLVINGKPYKGKTNCKNFIEQPKDNVIITICGEGHEVILNAPYIQSITLPNVMFVNCSIEPVKFKAMYTQKGLSDFTWCTSLDKNEWVEVGRNYKYRPTLDDLNKFLKLCCVPRNVNMEGPPFEVISNQSVTEMCPIPKCPFEERHEYTKVLLTNESFRVVSYNTLSNIYLSQFSYCPAEALAIDYRKNLILKELIGYNADIICLQELDKDIFANFLKPKLFKTYKGLFFRKGNRVWEGLACFFNTNRFSLLESIHKIYSEELRLNNSLSKIWNAIKKNAQLCNSIVKQPTSLQITVLKFKEINEILIVANTHLYYHSEANEARLIQITVALMCIKGVFNRYKRRKASKVSVILCGDFNSVPNSPTFNFLTQGDIDYEFDNVKEVKTISFSHQFTFKSAYDVPIYTNYTENFKGCLDYIFYEKDSLNVTQCVPIPEEQVLSENTALPSKLFPSDHIALIVDFKYS